LWRWLGERLAQETANWLFTELERQRSTIDERRLSIALGLIGRKVMRADLALSSDEIAAAQKLRIDWRPDLWGLNEAARVALLLATARDDHRAFAARLERLYATAEINEQIAYMKGLAVFLGERELHDLAREGARSSVRAVFDAVACHNPYPFDHFDDAGWNQMVVKCVFVGSPIETIIGLNERRNAELMQMLSDLISERQAAGRTTLEAVHAYIER
jgi:hypothetical protein